jgi:hypothetical protein
LVLLMVAMKARLFLFTIASLLFSSSPAIISLSAYLQATSPISGHPLEQH